MADRVSLVLAGDEIDAVLLGLRLVALQEESHLSGIADTMTDGLEAALGALAPPARAPRAAKTIAGTIAAALAAGRKLHLTYEDKKGKASERVVWPIATGVLPYADTLGAWCEMRQDFRHFRIDRIKGATLLPEKLPRHRRVLLAQLLAQTPEGW